MEANTIGSKANDISITGYMLEIKSEIEKIKGTSAEYRIKLEFVAGL